MNLRLCFLSHFVICLAIVVGGFFAYLNGVPQLVWANDVARYFGVTIGLLFLATMTYLAYEAWGIDSVKDNSPAVRSLILERLFPGDTVPFGHMAIWLEPSLGMLGTVVGLTLVFRNLGESTALTGGAVAFYSTGCGLVAMILTMVLVFNIESGIRRARRA